MYNSIILKLTCLINHEDATKTSNVFWLKRIFLKKKCNYCPQTYSLTLEQDQNFYIVLIH